MTSTAPAAQPAAGDRTGIGSGYRPPTARVDELMDADGSVRGPWRQVADDLDALGPDGLLARRDELARLLRNEGATYTVPAGDDDLPGGGRRPWTLDPVPAVLDAVEWAALEAGIAQRAALLDLVLTDLYGERRTVTSGLIPPEMAQGHPSFVRPCDGIAVPGGRHLLHAAVDLVRDGSGDHVVVSDRTGAPSGLGYALVNRTILSRVLPNLHRDAGVERLAGYFRAFRTEMARIAPTEVEEPRVVILTPGPHNETYFEHAFLAAYLGYALVEGRDLVVDNNRVWVRSLGGLDPVDVVVRRVDDDWCDPVELRPDSLLGVPGLVEASRRGRVTVFNPIGASVLENPALATVLDGLAGALLGEDLRLRSPATWWCGRPTELSHVCANLGRLVILPVDPGGPFRGVDASTLTSAELVDLEAQVLARPWAYVGRQRVEASTVPTVTDTGALEGRPAVLRAFTVASGDRYAVLPGGLTRVGASPDATSVSGRSGGTSKDTWVSTSQPALQQSAWLRPIRIPEADEAGVSGRAPGEPADGEVPRDLDTPLPSRAAAHLFIMGRAAEHAEVVIRLLRTVLARLDQPLGSLADDGAGGAASLGVLVEAIGVLAGFDTVSEPDRDDEDDRPDAEVAPVPEGVADGMGSVERRALAIVLDAGTDGSLVTSLSVLIDAAYSVREQLSADSWQIIGDVEEELARLRARPPTRLVGVQDGLQRLLRALLALAGLAAENMVRDPAWLFLDAGRRLERAQSLARLLRSVLVDTRPAVVEDLLLESLLKTGESLIVYRRRARSRMQVDAVLDLLVYDRTNPRSVLFQLDTLLGQLAQLPRGSSLSPAGRLSPEERLVLEAATALRLTDPGRLAAVDGGRRAHLDLVAERVDRLLTATLATLRRAYFAHERLAAMAERSLARVVPVRAGDRGPVAVSVGSTAGGPAGGTLDAHAAGRTVP